MPTWYSYLSQSYATMAHSISKKRKKNLLGNGPLCHILLEQAIKVKNLTNTITLN